MLMVDLLPAAGLLTEDRIARFSAAEEMPDRALSIYPNHATAHWVLGGVYISSSRCWSASRSTSTGSGLKSAARRREIQGSAQVLSGASRPDPSPRPDLFHNNWVRCLLLFLSQPEFQCLALGNANAASAIYIPLAGVSV